MELTLHRSDSRGRANFGWLKSAHSFSFGSYFDPQKMGFGLLRVLNDDHIDPATGFDTHSHDNMEIVTIPLSGEIRHKDSEGNEGLIRAGEVQIMSAGTGIAHSEYNNSKTAPADFLQIWVLPKALEIKPRYGQKQFPPIERVLRLQCLVSPDGRQNSLQINQQAYFFRSDLPSGADINYVPQNPGHGVYVFVIDGEVEIGPEILKKRDALGISNFLNFKVTARLASDVLFIEVPMQ